MAQQDPFATPALDAFVGGAIPSVPDPRDFVLPHLTRRGAAARINHDLRRYGRTGQSLMVPIGDQGAVGSCTGWAWARLRAAAAAKYHLDRGEVADVGDTLSARFIYDLERVQYEGTYPEDSGAQMRSGGQVIATYGVAPERYCPYTERADNGPIAQAIGDEAYAAARSYGVSTYYRLQGSGGALIDSLLACLDEGWPAVVAILVPPSFEQIGSNGRVPTPRRGEQVLGGHAVTICGNYQDAAFDGGGAFVVANQWGTGWGDHGYCYLPYSYATTSSGPYGTWLQEGWTCR
jgi:C1A family cysteine protease